ncbi:MAG: hypothetical protein H7138_20775, partial [Myxococcales bacterium]|nr:hypothetical protein [Myxococcales bacterium]
TDYGLVGAIRVVPGAGHPSLGVPAAPHADVRSNADHTTIEAMVLSCRVIGLQVAMPFLATVVLAADIADARPRGAIVLGPRNHPARSVFIDTGFTPQPSRPDEIVGPDGIDPTNISKHTVDTGTALMSVAPDGIYILECAGDLARVDPSIYRVTCAALARFDAPASEVA